MQLALSMSVSELTYHASSYHCDVLGVRRLSSNDGALASLATGDPIRKHVGALEMPTSLPSTCCRKIDFVEAYDLASYCRLPALKGQTHLSLMRYPVYFQQV
jgi:hypothetical protein